MATKMRRFPYLKIMYADGRTVAYDDVVTPGIFEPAGIKSSSLAMSVTRAAIMACGPGAIVYFDPALGEGAEAIPKVPEKPQAKGTYDLDALMQQMIAEFMPKIIGAAMEDALQTARKKIFVEEAMPTAAAQDVLAERQRQISEEGWTFEQDDQYILGQLALAAAVYTLNSAVASDRISSHLDFWPFPMDWWKPTTPRRDLVKAGALILAEIERRDRMEGRIAALAPAEAGGVEAREVLSGLSSYLGAGMGEDDTTAEEYEKRIRWGIDYQINATVQRCANVIEELSKQAYSGQSVPWGRSRAPFLPSQRRPPPHGCAGEGGGGASR